MTRVIAWMGLGSRYSWLAASRFDEISRATGAVFDWQPLASGELIIQAQGGLPFDEGAVGTDAARWRDEDVARWAEFYGIVCEPPRLVGIAPEAMALTAWCFDGEERGRVACAIMGEVFAGIEMTEARLAAISGRFGLTGESLASARRNAATRHARALEAALDAGAFGVPTLRTEDGAMVFGNDRLVLLEHHLARLRSG